MTLRRPLVGRAENLDRGHDAVPRLDVDDLDVAFGDRLNVEMDQDRLGRNKPVGVDLASQCSGSATAVAEPAAGARRGRSMTRTSG